MNTLPRCHADIKTPERTTSIVGISPCNAVMSPLPEGKPGLCGKSPNDGKASNQPWKISALAKFSPSKSVRRRAQTPQLRWYEPVNCRTPPTQLLSLQKGEQLKGQNLPEETQISYKSSCTSRKLKTSKFCLCPGDFVRGTSRCISKYGSPNTQPVNKRDPI